ncbi:uncharacterized protein LOC135962125 isoform X2 [Calliphora vicina]|uniref:uncharacterized protein LOC135962125 isoform X2 n=1 Tax=Calliphora vicina TaxID=7373 RepID=UPI00325AEFF3
MSNREHPTPSNDDKGTEAGAGCVTSQDFRQNHSAQRAPMPHELTAEWTVSAQLKFARAGETVKKEFSTNDTVNPVRVLYKWSKVDDNTTAGGTKYEDDKTSDSFKRTSSRSSARSQDPMKNTNPSEFQKGESFRSTTSSMTCGDIGGADSAFSGSNNSNKPQNDDTLTSEAKDSVSNFYGTRCRSTCNIIVTAVADFLSPTDLQAIDNVSIENPEMDSKPFVFNTTASYTVQPEKASYAEGAKQISLRDAVCQTSDTEMKYFGQHERKRSPLERRDSRRSYDHRRATVDDLLHQPGFRGRVSEENSYMPSYIPSTIKTSKSSSLPRVSSLMGGAAGTNVDDSCFPSMAASEKPSQSEAQKKPRTVHIDVYCTGSEDDDQADAESSSDSDDDDKRLDQESNSTFQTVLDNDQMRLRHQRITGHSLPRRLAGNNVTASPNQISESSKDISIGHAITKSSTAEEIHESKQLLFRKHVGDQRAVKLQNLRQKYLRQSSDDTLSLGYPNSSRSTIRDNTCSSISSILPGLDVAETSCKDTDELEDLSYSLAKSDSFEYENALDRLRIRQMERLWSRSHSNEDEPKSHQPGNSHLQSISEVNTFQRKSPSTSVVHQLDIVSETDQTSSYTNETFLRTSPVPAGVTAANYKFQQTSHFPRNKPGFLQFFGPHLEHSQPMNENILSQQPQSVHALQNNESTLLYPNYGVNLQRWKSETRDNLSASGTPVLTPTDLSRQTSPQPPLPHQTPPPYNIHFQRCGSETPLSTTSAITFPVTTPTPARRFDMYNRPSPAISEASTQPPPLGYSSEYLDKAKMFGRVVASRKPGHHVGPTKNPNCSCESCQRWLTERFQIRGRVFSLGEMPVLKRPS